MCVNYNQLLFSQLRLVPVHMDDTAPLEESRLVAAMTANEELLALGYTLAPRDVIALSKSPDLDGFVGIVRGSIGDVKAKPMYPDFPRQVMDMDEAVSRFHQMLHYLSTYGVEELTGAPVTRGWLPADGLPQLGVPAVADTEKTKSDDTLLSATVIALIDEKDKYAVPYQRILAKTERMDGKEQAIIRECVRNLSPDELAGVTIAFKQNMLDVFHAIFASDALTPPQKVDHLHSICQHTGDVWKCMDYTLTRCDYHFRTSQKRMLVQLLESYPIADFTANLILSGRKAERVILLLKYLDYNTYSRKPEYAQAVADLRGGTLHSWESRAKYLVAAKRPEALDYYAQRPGMMLRAITYLLRNGYDADAIGEKLAVDAAALRTQTLIRLMMFFSRSEVCWGDEKRFAEGATVRRILTPVLTQKLASADTPLRGKKVFVSMPEFDLDHSTIQIVDKSSEGGYIRSGLAYRIPETADRIRFFVYWNDKDRVDIDLHGAAIDDEGRRRNIGWNANFRSGELVFSGDITHSDAAEYIDVDLTRAEEDNIVAVTANIYIFSGADTFRDIDECYVGAMAVKQTGEEVKLYDPKNCFFSHYLTGASSFIQYGYIDVVHRCITFIGAEDMDGRDSRYDLPDIDNSFPLSEYLALLLRAQGATAVDSPGDADIVLVMGKPAGEKELSLVDANFFMDA